MENGRLIFFTCHQLLHPDVLLESLVEEPLPDGEGTVHQHLHLLRQLVLYILRKIHRVIISVADPEIRSSPNLFPDQDLHNNSDLNYWFVQKIDIRKLENVKP